MTLFRANWRLGEVVVHRALFFGELEGIDILSSFIRLLSRV